MTALLPIILAVAPKLFQFILAIAALKTEYPDLTPEMITALVVAATNKADPTFDAFIAATLADQATHPIAPK